LSLHIHSLGCLLCLSLVQLELKQWEFTSYTKSIQAFVKFNFTNFFHEKKSPVKKMMKLSFPSIVLGPIEGMWPPAVLYWVNQWINWTYLVNLVNLINLVNLVQCCVRACPICGSMLLYARFNCSLNIDIFFLILKIRNI